MVEDWDRVMDVNLRPACVLAKRLVPEMRERGWGRVVFVSSVAAFTGRVVGAHYTASKALIEGGETLPSDEETRQQLADLLPVGRLGRPEEVAQIVRAIVENPFVTAQTFLVNGRMYPH